MTTQHFDVVVIGGGIVGCAVARELGQRFSRVALMEKENSTGFHTSGRNSGVVHSGFNPEPGTLKAKLCVDGNKAIRKFCAQKKISFEQVGTYVIASDETQVPILYGLKKRGEENGVEGIEILSIAEVQKHEPNVKGVAGLYSPSGAIVDSQALTQALASDAKAFGVTLLLGQEAVDLVENKDLVEIHTQKDRFTAGFLLNCAGLYADRLAHRMGVGKNFVVAPFRGEYFEVTRPGPPVIESMVYPVPNPVVPFLGVHLTRTVMGSVLIGPNAVPAFGREAYQRSSFCLKDLAEMAGHAGFWNAFKKNRSLIKIAWNELRHSCSKRHFLSEASKLVNGLHVGDLSLGRRVGIRPQLIDSDGQLVEDLVVETTQRSVHILNVVSPGMTSALAFARWVSEKTDDSLRWCRNVASHNILSSRQGKI